MVVQSLENLEILKKSGNKILVRENLEKSGNLLKESKMLSETMLFHTATRHGANVGNVSGQMMKLPLGMGC